MHFVQSIAGLTALLALVSAAPAEQLRFSAQATQAESHALLSPNFAHWAESLLGEWGVPGAAVGLIKIDYETDKVHTEFVNVGTAGRGRNVTSDTLFGIASNSKAFTAAAVAQLVDAGKLNWTTLASDIIPDFGFLDEFADSRATIKDILSHKTGLPRHDRSYRQGMGFDAFVSAIKHLIPSTGFREEYQYNNQMLMASAYLVSHLSGEPFTDAVARSIFAPLGMKDSTYAPHLDPASLEKVSSSFYTLPNRTVIEIPYGFDRNIDDLQMNAGAGGVVTSARDGLKWVEFLLRQRHAATKKDASAKERTALDAILSRENVLEMSSGQTVAQHVGEYSESSMDLYGLGLHLAHYQGVQTVRHGGAIPGFGTQILWSSELGLGVVAYCNTMESGNSLSDILSYRAFDQAAELAQIDWNARYLAKRDKALAATNAAHSAAFASASLVAASTASDASAAGSIASLLGQWRDAGYGDVFLCPVPELASLHPSSAECDELYTKIQDTLPAISDQPLEPLSSALLIYTPDQFFGTTHIALRFSGEEGVWKGKYMAVFDLVEEDGSQERKASFGEGEDDSVEVRFVDGGRKMEWSGVWGPGPAIKAKPGQVEVRFVKV